MFPDLVKLLVQILLIAGALNWGSIALVGTDIVRSAVGFGKMDRLIKLAVGAAGVIAGLELVKMQIKTAKQEQALEPTPVAAPVAAPLLL